VALARRALARGHGGPPRFRDHGDGDADHGGLGDRRRRCLEQDFWEVPESGERRSSIEIVADDVGPSLKYATAEISRNERHTADDAQMATAGAGDANGSGA
jgi:hypothetical protein